MAYFGLSLTVDDYPCQTCLVLDKFKEHLTTVSRWILQQQMQQQRQQQQQQQQQKDMYTVCLQRKGKSPWMSGIPNSLRLANNRYIPCCAHTLQGQQGNSSEATNNTTFDIISHPQVGQPRVFRVRPSRRVVPFTDVQVDIETNYLKFNLDT